MNSTVIDPRKFGKLRPDVKEYTICCLDCCCDCCCPECTLQCCVCCAKCCHPCNPGCCYGCDCGECCWKTVTKETCADCYFNLYMNPAQFNHEEREVLKKIAEKLSKVVARNTLPKRVIERQLVATMCGYAEGELDSALKDVVFNYAFSAGLVLLFAKAKLGKNVAASSRICDLQTSSKELLMPSVAMILIDNETKISEVAVRHEMVHALGFGNLWGYFGERFKQTALDRSAKLYDPDNAVYTAYNPMDGTFGGNEVAEPVYTGIRGTQVFQDETLYQGGTELPPLAGLELFHPVNIKSQLRAGTWYGAADLHWSRDEFPNALMGPIHVETNVLSAITIASLEDLGYNVDEELQEDFEDLVREPEGNQSNHSYSYKRKPFQPPDNSTSLAGNQTACRFRPTTPEEMQTLVENTFRREGRTLVNDASGRLAYAFASNAETSKAYDTLLFLLAFVAIHSIILF